MKKLALLIATTAMLAACGEKNPGAQPALNAEPLQAASNVPAITYATIPAKQATYDPNLQPASKSVTLSLGK